MPAPSEKTSFYVLGLTPWIAKLGFARVNSWYWFGIPTDTDDRPAELWDDEEGGIDWRDNV